MSSHEQRVTPLVITPGRARPMRRRLAEGFADLAYWLGAVTLVAIAVLIIGTLALWLQP